MIDQTSRTAVLIVAAGRGRRLGGTIPKQYIPIEGLCALRRTVDLFLSLPQINSITTVIHPDDKALYDAAVDGLVDHKLREPVPGGETRAASVRNGLTSLDHMAPDLVLIHDAARPFIAPVIVENTIKALGSHQGACVALPVVDALWRSDGDLAASSIPRDGLWRAQTPQGFHFAAIRAAHADHDGTGADDVFVARAAGIPVAFVLGDEANYKITTAADLERAKRDIRQQS
ncbi:2-C-methyl-D-erythritol 4-phosphate cytidylyltransferase [Yoonia sp. SS1-5]|uniref:2-C-methyl-D-erythritol 4-phosphate cytidylyltransferase n=1 Tax=Yoonia rhodophyticola TaxID=3137370 RepID=A0AAN0NM65_9RHOB